jgi:MSHA biogenesis protein MshQ
MRMRMRMRMVLAFGALLAAGTVGATTPVNLIQNGSFETFSPCYSCWNGSTGHQMTWGARQVSTNAALNAAYTLWGSTLPSWGGYAYDLSTSMANNGWIDFYGLTQTLAGKITDSPDGGQFLAVSWGVQTTVTGLTVGTSYDLSFYQGVNYLKSSNGAAAAAALTPTPQYAIAATFGGVQKTATYQNMKVNTFSGWAQQTLSFVATASSQTLNLDVVFQNYAYDIRGSGPLVLLDGVKLTVGTPAGPDHLVLKMSSASGVTCQPATVTIAACADAACAQPYTGGIGGTLSSGNAAATWPAGAAFSIAAGASATTLDLQLPVAGSTVLGTGTLTPAAIAATSCNFGSPSCTFTSTDAALLITMPPHYTFTSTSGTVSAVKKADNSNACVPAFASVTKNVRLTCAYLNPSSGSGMVSVNSAFLNSSNSNAACDSTGANVPLSFNASGVAPVQLLESDVGQYQLNGKYTGSGTEAGLVMSGATSFIAAPAKLVLTLPTGSLVAGQPFSVQLTARNNNSATGGDAQPNWLKETPPQIPTISFTRASPTGTGVSDGAYTGTLGQIGTGSVKSVDSIWSEVGKGDLTFTIANYLGSGLSTSISSGTSGALGPFTPDHFDVAVDATPACGSFAYAGQPFGATLTARNAAGSTTTNYDGSGQLSPVYAKAHTLSVATTIAAGSWSNASIAASNFSHGVAQLNSTAVMPSYSFTSKLTAPQMLQVRTTDTDGVSSASGNPLKEGTVLLRSGRLRLFDAYGTPLAPLSMQAQTEFWNGQAWVPNAQDNCTLIPATSLALYNAIDNHGVATTSATTTSVTVSALTIVNGHGTLALSAPANVGSFRLAPNLGARTSTSACVASIGANAPGATLAWLRSQYGAASTDASACPGGSWGSDPSARASFGISSPETQRNIRVTEMQ